MGKRGKRGLLLAPGAGADSASPALIAIEDAVDSRFSVRRMDFPYRKAGRRAPDRQPVLVQSVVEEATELARDHKLKAGSVFLGGRSMGGRMCSIAVAEGLPAAGLVLVSYPLHPPGKPKNLRVEHFPDIDVPCLFVSGTGDAFGTPKELEKHIGKISGEVTIHFIEGADHGMKKYDNEMSEIVAEWLDAR